MGLAFSDETSYELWMVNSFRNIIGLWGKPDSLAADIGAKDATVRKWRQRDSIPGEWWYAISRTKMAKQNGVTVERMAEISGLENALRMVAAG